MSKTVLFMNVRIQMILKLIMMMKLLIGLLLVIDDLNAVN